MDAEPSARLIDFRARMSPGFVLKMNTIDKRLLIVGIMFVVKPTSK
jgi:hypothetical protein